MSLQEKLEKQKQSTAQKAPKEALEVMHRAVKDLENSGQAAQAVGVGDTAPEFTLQGTDGNEVALKDLLAQGPVVLTFYRGKW